MPWFLVDDQFHSHPKALATEPAALGLWVVAGSWSSAHLTDGVVPDDVLPRLLPDAVKLAEALVDAGLWRRVKGGYKISQPALCKIPSRQAVENDRSKAADRKRRQRARHAGVTPSVTPVSRSGKPVENEDDQRKPRSGDAMSRRDNGVTHAVTLDRSDPDPSGGSVINPVAGGNARASPDVIDLIMDEIHKTTGRHITPEWAQRVHDHILDGRAVASPTGYIRQAIRSEPDPKRRFLPLY